MSIGIGSSSGIDMTALYQSLFQKIDSDNNGSISKSEFENSVSSIDRSGSSTSSTSTADAMFSKLDTDGNGTISETELMDALKQAGERTRANMPPPPPPPSGADGSASATSLTDDQKKSVDSILSKYDSSNLTQSDVKSINQAFRDAGITFGKSLGDEVESQGFDIGTMMRLATSTSTSSTDATSSTSVTSSAGSSDTTATVSTTASSTASTTSVDDSLLAGLVQYLNSSSSGSSSGQESELLQRVKASTGLNDDQISSLFNSFLNSLAGGAQYDQSGSTSYAVTGSENLFGVSA